MDSDNKEQNHSEEDIDWEAFFKVEDAQEWKLEKQQRKKRKKFIIKIVSSLLVVALVISGLDVWVSIFNLPAINFVKVSTQLSAEPDIKEYKKSVATIEWDGVKGTGFAVSSTGFIVTNEHVVERTNRVNVHFNSGDSYVGKVIARHPELDIAIVDIETENLPHLPLSFEKEWEKWAGRKSFLLAIL